MIHNTMKIYQQGPKGQKVLEEKVHPDILRNPTVMWNIIKIEAIFSFGENEGVDFEMCLDGKGRPMARNLKDPSCIIFYETYHLLQRKRHFSAE